MTQSWDGAPFTPHTGRKYREAECGTEPRAASISSCPKGPLAKVPCELRRMKPPLGIFLKTENYTQLVGSRGLEHWVSATGTSRAVGWEMVCTANPRAHILNGVNLPFHESTKHFLNVLVFLSELTKDCKMHLM